MVNICISVYKYLILPIGIWNITDYKNTATYHEPS